MDCKSKYSKLPDYKSGKAGFLFQNLNTEILMAQTILLKKEINLHREINFQHLKIQIISKKK